MLARPYSDLFVYNNYRFSTSESGRLTSLYFEDAQGNQGRWRREHPLGELLIWQGKSIRLFINPRQTSQFRPDTALRIYHDIRDGIGNYPNYSVRPKEQWHVIEMCPPTFYVRHSSSGRILRIDPTAGAADYAGLANYTGAIADWTLPEDDNGAAVGGR